MGKMTFLKYYFLIYLSSFVKIRKTVLGVMLVWSFWTDRNDLICFQQEKLGSEGRVLGDHQNYGPVNGVGSQQERLHNQPWSPPPHGVHKINTDDMHGYIGIGVIIRDVDGMAIAALSKKITSFFSPLVAELLGVDWIVGLWS